jgi:hypothetical protein
MDRYGSRGSPCWVDSIEILVFAVRRHILRWTKGGYARSSTSILDAFYASVEQRDDPTLKGKQVVVGYPAKRDVIAAASYEARAFGVRSVMPLTVAMRKCAEPVFVSPRFDVYCEVSKRIHPIFEDYTPLVEPLSLDEAYLDATDNLKGIPTAWKIAKEIRARIHEETASKPRQEFPATNFSRSSHRTIANQTVSSRSYRTTQKRS